MISNHLSYPLLDAHHQQQALYCEGPAEAGQHHPHPGGHCLQGQGGGRLVEGQLGAHLHRQGSEVGVQESV